MLKNIFHRERGRDIENRKIIWGRERESEKREEKKKISEHGLRAPDWSH